ncbi:MAG: tripartite tricarboxylate transporter permease [Deltaproteobacteria bacterium]|nr:tripartite tricarboxylate transporter permease [Deltaproteobacteria bacterium]MBW2086595.1 tripartite tricarboxylate transporter permease [Deltaproteobacteria bacterium]
MEFLNNLALGFSVAFSVQNVLFCFLGAFLGTFLGALPGVGAIMGVALLVPLTFSMDPITAMIMLAGIYYGGQYGCAISAILLNIPGDAPAILTIMDGYPMAQQGRAGPALAIAAIGSFIAGTFGVLALSLVAVPLVHFALHFGPPEYFALILASLVSLAGIFGESVIKSLMMVVLGLMVGTFGMDPVSGAERLTFGSVNMMNGFSFIAVALGIFVIPELLKNITSGELGEVFKAPIKRILPTREDFSKCKYTIPRSSVLGFIVGALPGAGTTLAAVLAYTLEKKVSPDAKQFGHGAIQGVCAAESANNAGSAGAFVPLLALGIPGSAVTAIMLGAFMMFGLRPGPLLIKSNPDLVWGLICSMYIGNILLLILNLPLIRLWVKIIQIPYHILVGIILLCSTAACYASNGNIFDLYVMFGFGILGWIVSQLGYSVAPILLGLILGPILEYNFRDSLIISDGNPSIFFTRPISLIFIIYTILIIVVPVGRRLILQSRNKA